MSDFKHLMLDLETMSTDSTAAIISIGAVEFDIITGRTGKSFYANIDLQSCLDLGLTVEASTIMWWLKQSDEARQSLSNISPNTISEVLIDFQKFIGDNTYYIWAKSPSFDCVILKNAFQKVSLKTPWAYLLERDVRTILFLNPELAKTVQKSSIAHNALADCFYQIEQCHVIWKSIFPENL